MGAGENDKKEAAASCQLLPGGFAGTGPNGSFFETPGWVDKVIGKRGRNANAFNRLLHHDFMRNICLCLGQGPRPHFPGCSGGPARVVGQDGHGLLAPVQP